MRGNERADNALRTVKITPHYLHHLPSSILIEMGSTRVLCTAIIEEKVPVFLKNTDSGWLTAEYGMMPNSTPNRINRENGVIRHGRHMEIQRLIGRSLRTAFDLKNLGTRTIQVDCDVLEADGGTRTASITGSYVAVCLALQSHHMPISLVKRQIASISVGLLKHEVLLDLDFLEDSQADVDLNVVMDDSGNFIEIQGTGEKRAFSLEELNTMLQYGKKGITELFDEQNKVLSQFP
ncbi:MAG: ribonuclease PH [Caldisericia bacterium]|nr:ribonuclease PH [Caldisericia bacterium]